MRRSTIKYLGITIVIITILVFGYVGMKSAFSPFKTEEQKQVKELYSKSVKNTNNFTLLRVNPNIKESWLVFNFILKWPDYNQIFSENDLSNMNLIVDQMIDYLNEVNNYINIYNYIQLKFFVGQGNYPEYIQLAISYGENGYYFSGIDSEYCNDLCDFYMMTNVINIRLNRSNELEYNEEKIEKLSNLKNLKEIYYVADIDGDYFYLLKKKLQIILPECKLYAGDKEIVIEE